MKAATNVMAADRPTTQSGVTAARREGTRKISVRSLGLIAYLVLLLLPIYWMLNMSLRDNNDIMTRLAFFPHHPTLGNYIEILTDPAWYMGYVN